MGLSERQMSRVTRAGKQRDLLMKETVMIEALFIVVFGGLLGAALGKEVKSSTTLEQRKRLNRLLNFFSIGLVCILFLIIRPELPKEGFWKVFHTKEELTQYKKVQDLIEQIELINKNVQQRINE